MTLRHAMLAAVICSTATAFASDYITHGVDPGRTGWIKDGNVFTKANVGKMKLLWKVKLESTPREMHNLFNPLILQNVTTAQGAREMAVVAGVSDHLFGIDVASGELVWKKHFDGAPRRFRAGAAAARSAPAVRLPSPSSVRDLRRASTPSTPSPGTGGCARWTWRPVRNATAAQPPAQPAGGRGFGAAAPGIPMVPGQAWLLASTTNAIVAFKIDPGDKPSLTPAWTSRTLTSPAAPLVVNNVVFAVSSGQPAAPSGAGSAAVLYALNAMTGKEIWNSGTVLKSYMPGRALWTSNSQVYVGGNDAAIYAFGFALERK